MARISDGLTAQTVDVQTAVSRNSAPRADKILRVSAYEETARYSKISANDPNNDPLTYTIGLAPSHGTLTVGADGLYVYTPYAGYIGPDTFSFLISDGNLTTTQDVEMWVYKAIGGNTGTPVQNPDNGSVVTPTPTPTPTPSVPVPPLNAGAAEFRTFTADGFVGEIGGHGAIFGTNGFQDIRVLDQAGTITFDGSFNQGGDIIRLAGEARNWSVSFSGSNAIFADGDTQVAVPYGAAGTAILFADGVRSLRFDAASGDVKIGGQTVSETAAWITAETDNSVLPTGIEEGARSRVFLTSGGDIAATGNVSIFGTTTGSETVHVSHGSFELDGSFNRGGDKIEIDSGGAAVSARVSGSNVIFTSDDLELIIPYGSVGATVAIGGGVERALRYDAEGGVLFGSQAIGDDLVQVWNGVF